MPCQSHLDIKRKTCDIQTWKKKAFISWHILHQHWYTCPIALPVRRNQQRGSLLTVVSVTFAPPFQPRHQRSVFHQFVNRFTRQTLPTVNRKHFFMNILCIESFYQKKTHSRTLLFGSIPSKSRHFDYWNQYLNMRMRVCYLDCHEAGLCCYLVTHIENLLRPLQIFYFRLWPIYWLSLVHCAVGLARRWRIFFRARSCSLLRPQGAFAPLIVTHSSLPRPSFSMEALGLALPCLALLDPSDSRREPLLWNVSTNESVATQ
jgi:hypothetical protein